MCGTVGPGAPLAKPSSTYFSCQLFWWTALSLLLSCLHSGCNGWKREEGNKDKEVWFREKRKKLEDFLQSWNDSDNNQNNSELIIFVISQHNFQPFNSQHHFPLLADSLSKLFSPCHYFSKKQSNVDWTNSVNRRISLKMPKDVVLFFILQWCWHICWQWNLSLALCPHS